MCYNRRMELKKIATPKRIEILKAMGIESVEDVLAHYPFRYENHEQRSVASWQVNDKIFTSGVICSFPRVIRFGGKKSITRFSMMIEGEEFLCSIFNRPWTNAFGVGKTLTISGIYQGSNKITLINANANPIENQLGLQPIYSTTQSMSQNDWIKLMDKALSVSLEHLEDRIPEEYRLRYKLLKRREAIYFIHKPKSQLALTQALRTLKYEEFLIFQCCMQISRNENMKDLGVAKEFSNEEVYDLTRNLSFELTKDQMKCIDEILTDLHSSHCMMRMLQGDVG